MTDLTAAHRARFDALINRPLMADDADLLVKLAYRLNIPITWQHKELLDHGWTDGRYQAGDELPPPADDDEPIMVDWPQHQQVEFAA